MSALAFKFSSLSPIAAQPDPGGEQLIARSSDAADTGNLTLTGLVGSANASETNALNGKIEVVTTALFKTLRQVALSAAQVGTIKIFAEGTAGSNPMRLETNPADGDTLAFGLLGFEVVYRFKTTPAAAFDVKIGASPAATSLNLKKAINADGLGDGTDYFAGTTAHPDVTAVISGTFVTLTDRIAVLRQLAWSFAESASNFSLPENLSGGTNGTLLATLAPGTVKIYSAFTLATEDLGGNTLPGKVTGSSQPVQVGGKPCSLQFKCAAVSSAIALNYETSTDRINWAAGATAITSLNDNPVEAPLLVVPGEQNVEYIRLNITGNTNTSYTALDARVIF